jgi:signal transduction histidine kinase
LPTCSKRAIERQCACSIQREQTDLNTLVRSVVGEQAADELVAAAPGCAAARLALDPARMRLAVRNLLDNACCAMAPKVARRPRSTALDSSSVVVAVPDSAQACRRHLLHLGEPFFRAGTHTRLAPAAPGSAISVPAGRQGARRYVEVPQPRARSRDASPPA